jgi:hypothetical protein
MAHLIKLESGQLFNLDTMTHTTTWEDGIVSAILVNGGHVNLSRRDLAKIELDTTGKLSEETFRDLIVAQQKSRKKP